MKTLTKSKITVLIYITISLKKTMKLIEQIQQKLDQFLTMFWVVPFRKKCPYIRIQRNYGKIQTRKNLVYGHFLYSDIDTQTDFR